MTQHGLNHAAIDTVLHFQRSLRLEGGENRSLGRGAIPWIDEMKEEDDHVCLTSSGSRPKIFSPTI